MALRLLKRIFRGKNYKATTADEPAATPVATIPAPPAPRTSTEAAAKTATKTTPRKSAKTGNKAGRTAAPRGQAKTSACGATTAAGSPCSRSARTGSKYCGLHKNYRASASATKTAAAKPVATKRAASAKAASTRKASPAKATTKSATRSATKSATQNGGSSKEAVTHNGYKLYQKGNRYWFGKKASAGATLVYQLPAGRTVVETPTGLPVLKKK